MAEPFRVGIDPAILQPDGSIGFGGGGLPILEQIADFDVSFFPRYSASLEPRHIAGYDAILLLGGRVDAETLAGNDRLALVARAGVGYDNVDVPACTANGTLLTITPEAIRRPMAVVNLTYLLALSSRLLEQDRITREGRWAEKQRFRGTGLMGKTVGTIGFGRIGQEFHTISRPLGMRHVAFDPYADRETAKRADVALVDLEHLLRESDFVVVAAALTPDTNHLLNAERLAMMKPTAFLISTARGPIVDQAALTAMLRDRRIAGAGLDVFEQEPVDPNDPILKLDNVIVSPHALCWTDECDRIMGESVARSMQEVAAGRVPVNAVNRDAADSPQIQARLAAIRERKKNG
ncbi:MAG: NAD(P)-dependent oxidoreductase [Thermomicrobiales bacterium]